MPNYFSNFPKLTYRFQYLDKDNNFVDVLKNLVNITVKVNLSQEVLANCSSYYAYQWQEDDRPDTFADFYYNTNDFYWLVMHGGNKFDVFNEFPKDERQFNEFIYRKYREAAIETIDVSSGEPFLDTPSDVNRYAKLTVAKFLNNEGFIVDEFQYPDIPEFDSEGRQKKTITIYEDEFAQNQELGSIRVVADTFSKGVKTDFELALRKIRAEIEKNES